MLWYVRYQNEKKFFSSIFYVVYFHSSLHLYNNVGFPAGTNNAIHVNRSKVKNFLVDFDFGVDTYIAMFVAPRELLKLL